MASLAPIVITPVGSEIVALAGEVRLSVKFSAGSAVASSAIGTAIVLALSPGAKVRVPETAV